MKPSAQESRTAFIFLRAGIFVRNFVNRELLSQFERSGHRFVIFAPEPDHPFLRRHFAAPCFEIARFDLSTGRDALSHSRLKQFFVLLRRYTYANPRCAENGCRHGLLAALRREHIAKAGFFGRLYYQAMLGMARLASRSRLVRAAACWLEGKLGRFEPHAEYYRRYRPAITIVNSLGFDLDTLIMREARHFGAKNVVLVKNWDVPTTRGIGGIIPDWVLVWNDIMRGEVIRYHDVSPARVRP